MAQTVTVDAKTIRAILTRLDQIDKKINAISAKALEKEPVYGSDEWWEKEVKEGEEELKKGKYTSFSSKRNLQQYLNSLK